MFHFREVLEKKMFPSRKNLLAAAFAVMTFSQLAQAQAIKDIDTEQLRRTQEREAQQRRQRETEPDVHLQQPGQSSAALPLKDESPCFPIKRIALSGEGANGFSWLLDYADGHAQLPQPDPVVGRCVGVQGIQIVIDRMQNALISRGFVTTRVLAGPQSLQGGDLVLTLVPGRGGEVRWAPGTGARGSRWNTVPRSHGDLLNLRDIEQALENFKRVPTAEADIQIAPGTEPGTSDLVIAYQQQMPFRVSATADDSGTRSTGKFQGSTTFSCDNCWTLSDLFYITWLHDLGGRDPGARGTRGHIVHYSVPFGYWLAGFTQSKNRYHQTVAGANQDYLYSGNSRNTEFKLARVVHRDAVGKTTFGLKGFQRTSNNFIDDTEVEVQRRVVSGMEWSLNHRRSWKGGSLDANATFRRGTGAWGSLTAPEEQFGEGTSRMRMWLLDATVSQSFTLGGQRLQYSGEWRGQFNRTPLSPQDRFSIAGRYTVRGFDGLWVLSAEHGWLLRNEVSMPVPGGLRAYGGVDTGHVGGPSAGTLVGTSLTGAVLGLRGQLPHLQYEVFVGKPLRKPELFRTSGHAAGFSLAMSL
jgi:hemolysin activation/secretion protein